MEEATSTRSSVRACLQCKQKKIRCLSDKESDTCQRCSRMNLRCVHPDSYRRPRKKLHLNERVEQLETSLDEVMSFIANQPHASITLASTTPRPTADPSKTTPAATIPTTPFTNPPPKTHQDVIDRGLLCIERAQALLYSYVEMAGSFPYVLVSSDAALPDLRRQTPTVFLAIMVTASWQDRSLQMALDHEYLTALSSRLIVEGRKDLDLLQGLLVYLAWAHLHLRPESQQVYRMVAISAAIAVDLGLNKPPRKSQQQNMNIEIRVDNPGGVYPTGADYWNPEARRAYLGCYYLASSYSAGMRKVNPLRYDEYLVSSAASLAQELAVPSDAYLIHQLRLLRCIEDACETFGYSEPRQPRQMSDEQTQMYVNAFSGSLQEWRSSFPSMVAKNTLWQDAAEIYVREIGVHGMIQGSNPSVVRITLLYDSLVHAKKYLDSVLSIPVATLQNWSTPEWIWLNYIVVVIAKISSAIKSPAWNIEMARRTLKLEVYIDRLSTVLQEIYSCITPMEGAMDWYRYLLFKFDLARTEYMNSTQWDLALSEASTGRAPASGGQPGSSPDGLAASGAPTMRHDGGIGGMEGIMDWGACEFGTDMSLWLPSNVDTW